MNSPQTSPAETSRSYEFDARQNEVISELAKAMRWVAIPLMVAGLLYLMNTVSFLFMLRGGGWRLLLPVAIMAVSAIIFLAMAVWTNRSSAGFAEVVATQGSDVDHLMSALDNLRKMYSLMSLFVKIYIFMMVLTLISLLIAYFTGTIPRPVV